MAAAKNDSDVPAKAKAEVDSKGRTKLVLGMASEEVAGLIGKPAKIKPIKTETGKAEVWVYTYAKTIGATQTATGVRHIIYIDPITNETRSYPEATYSMEHQKAVETTELLMVDGCLVNWKRYQTLDREYQ